MKPINRVLFTLIWISLFIGLYFFACTPSHEDLQPAPKNPSYQLSQAQGEIVLRYQQRTRRLEAKNDSLVQSIAKGKSDITALRKQVRDLKFTLSQKLAAGEADTVLSKDTAFKTEVSDLIVLSGRQDSLCEQTINQLEELAATKDTIISSCLHRTFQTDSLLSVSLEAQRQLEKQFKEQAKTLRKRQRGISFLSAGLLIFSTSSLILLLTRH